MDPLDSKRRTGRTTRLVQYALEQATVHNRSVYILTGTASDVTRLQNMVDCMAPPDTVHGIVVRCASDVPELDWQSLRIWRGSMRTLVLLDHYAIERKFGPLLQMWMMFDRPDQADQHEADTPS